MRGVKRIFTAEESDNIRLLYREGAPVYKIAEAHNAVRSTVVNLLRDVGDYSPVRDGYPDRSRIDQLEFSGDRLTTMRNQSNLSQSQLAELIGLKSLDVIRRWEREETFPSCNYTIRLVLALKCHPRDICAKNESHDFRHCSFDGCQNLIIRPRNRFDRHNQNNAFCSISHKHSWAALKIIAKEISK